MTKCSMRQLLCITLFLLYCTCGCFAASVVQQLPQKGQSVLQTYTASTTDPKNGNEWQPIRFAVYTKFVEDAMMHCINKTSPENRMEFSPELCEGPNKMTTEKMNTLFKDVLPEAIKLHRDRLNVKPVTGKLKLWKEEYDEDQNMKFARNCNGIDIPKEHLDEGVDNADFLLYVVLLKSYEGAFVCTRVKEDNRPTSARINFVPKDIVATRQYIRLTAHEIAHALGFAAEYMHKYLDTTHGPIFTNGEYKWPIMVKSNTVKLRFEKHYKCNTIAGMILDYKENRYSTHWERRIARDELMSPYTGESSGMFYTAMTLAAFDAMPYYTANFSMAERMSWGNQSGCEFITKTCTKNLEELQKISNVFCNESESALQCTSDRFALGVCSKDDKSKHVIPAEYNYFQTVGGQSAMMEGCPIIKPFQQTTCENGNETLMPGSIVSNMSRCLNVKDLKFNEGHAGNGVTVQGICAKVTCEDGKVKVQSKGMRETEWHVCEKDGDEIKPESSVFKSVTIVCPKYEEVCTGLPKTAPFTIQYEEVVEPKTEEEEEEQKQEGETKEQGSSSTESKENGGVGEQNQTHKGDDNKDDHADSSTAVSFFGPLMLLVCAVAAVVDL